jgi:hypothetical protein
MSYIRTPLALALILFSLVSTASCREGTSPELLTHDGHAPLAASRIGVGQLDDAVAREVRQLTARFSSLTQAAAEGYAVASACVAAPGLGGMGVHWMAMQLLDPVFDASHPEAVLYEPQKNGRMELVAVEYIVVDVGQPAPTFNGQPFDVGGTPLPIPHWSLHVWLYRDNPSGMFTPFNPAVSCP